jgi:tryptophan synthase alpha chain
MTRIDDIFAHHRAARTTALMPFLTAGYPDLETTGALIPALEKAGASICEIGIPFSDPIADGPVIASSMHDALENGFRLDAMFDMIRAIRPATSMGLIAMVSYSIVHRTGLVEFINRSRDAGFDGFIFPDLPIEESTEACRLAREANLTCSLLISPTTPIERARQIADACTGFVYLLARIGITGERADAPQIAERVNTLRNNGRMQTPIACGFGIASPESVRAVTEHADAAIVGSAIIKRMMELHNEKHAPRDEMVTSIADFTRHLATGLKTR